MPLRSPRRRRVSVRHRDAVLAERAGDILAIADHLQDINRGILNRLRPMALGQVPLADLLGELVRERARQQPQIALTATIVCRDLEYGDTVDLTVYRCIQESLTNAMRHADAKAITVRVTDLAAGNHDAANFASADRPWDGRGTRLELVVTDDGQGVAAGSREGLGLRGMRERVEALDGEFTVTTGDGTSVRVVIPLPTRPGSSTDATDSGGDRQ